MSVNLSGCISNPYVVWEYRKTGLTESFVEHLNKIKEHMDNLQFLKALEVIKQNEINFEGTQHEKLTLLTFKMHSLRELGEYDQVKTLADEFLTECEKIKNFNLAYQTSLIASISEYYRGNKNTSHHFIQQASKYFNKLTFLTDTEKLIQSLWLELQNGWVFSLEGKYDEQFKSIQHVLIESKTLDKKDLEAWALVGLGRYYISIGNITDNLETTKKGLDLALYLKDQLLISIFKKDLGIGYRIIGLIDEALKYQHEFINSWIPSNAKTALQYGFCELGITYHLKGNYQLAYENYSKTITICNEIKNYTLLSEALARMIQLLSDWQKVEDIQECLQRLKLIEGTNQNTKTAYLIGKGISHRVGKRIKDKAEALNCFNEVINNSSSLNEFKILALFNVLELFLEELELTGANDAMIETKQVAGKLREMANKQHNTIFQAELDFLNAKLALLEFDFNGARNLMYQAEKKAQRSGCGRLALKISREHDRIISAIDHKEQSLINESPLNERAHYVGIKDYYSVIAKKIYVSGMKGPKNEISVALMISTQGGLMIYFHPFSNDIRLSEHLVGGFLSAISAFGMIIFNKEDQIDRIFFKENTLLLTVIDKILFCYIIKGESYNARKKLNEFVISVRANKELWELIRENNQEKKIKVNLDLDKIASDSFYSSISESMNSLPMIDDLLVN